jgi:YidC/Oxa1 family membrane protein insertase
MSLLNTFFFDPFLNVLMLLSTLLGGNLGWAIIALTLLFRLAVLPLNWKSLHSQRKMQQLKPHLDALKDKHGKDKSALAQAQMDLYKEHGVSPVGGCLPMLLQVPFLFGVYAAMRFVVSLKQAGDLNSHLYTDWLHIHQLSDLHLQFGWVNLAHPDPLFILPVLAAASQFVVSKMTLPPVSPASATTKQEASLEQSMLSAQRQMVYFFPIMTFLIAWRFPSGLSLYWTVGNLFSIIQQFFVNRALPHPTAQLVVAEAPTIAPEVESQAKKTPVKKKKSTKRK